MSAVLPAPAVARLEARLAELAAGCRVTDVRALAFPVAWRYGRRVALCSWHLAVTVRGDGRLGTGLVPGYAASPAGALRAAARLRREHSAAAYASLADATARAAVETALLDLAGAEELGLPAGPVLLEGMVWFHRDAGRMEDEARRLAARGFRRAKVKLCGDPDADARALDAVLRVFPPDAVRADANRSYRDRDSLLRFATRYAEAGGELVEEPSADPSLWPELREAAGLQVVADESLLDPALLRSVLAGGLADGVNVKLSRVGGPLPALALAERARAAGLRALVGCSEDLGSGMAAVLHVAASTPEQTAEGFGAFRLGVESWDRTVGPLEDGATVGWPSLGSGGLPGRPRSRPCAELRSGAVAAAVGASVRAAQALASRAPARRRGCAPVEVLSPELGWVSARAAGGARYEEVAAGVLHATGRARLLVPRAQGPIAPGRPGVGRLWLPRGNRAGVLGLYLPLQLSLELLRHRPHVLRLHSVSHLGPGGTLAAVLARQLGWRGRVVLHAHHVEPTGAIDTKRGMLARRLDRLVLSRADAVVVPSPSTRDALVASAGVPADRIAVVPAALPPPVPAPRRELRDELSLLFVGRLGARKRPLLFLDLVRALSERRRVSARLVGDGPLRDAVADAARGLPVTTSAFEPSLERAFAEAHALVCTSEVEGFYLAGLEALQRGRPVFGFDVPALRDLLGKELAARCLVPEGDLPALVDRLARLEDAHLLDLRREGLARAAVFSPRRFAAGLLEALES